MTDPVSILAGSLGKNIFDATFRSLSKQISGLHNLRLWPNTSALMWEATQRLLTEVHNWVTESETGFTNPNHNKSTYIALNYSTYPLGDGVEERPKSVLLSPHLARMQRPLVILGRPGFGKTTTLKAIASEILKGTSAIKDVFPIPLPIRLREMDHEDRIIDYILSKFHVGFCDSDKGAIKARDVGKEVKQGVVLELINTHKIVLLIDGFDEIGSRADSTAEGGVHQKDRILREFQSLVYGCEHPYMFLTSRSADFPFRVPGTDTYELIALSAPQVNLFIEQYFRNQKKASAAKKLILEKKLLGAEYVPLTLSYICLLVSRGEEIPATRRDTFEKIINLLLSDWDVSRNIRRPTRFREFDLYEKRRFLARLAFELGLTARGAFFTVDEVRKTFELISEEYDEIKLSDFRTVLDELETHTGLFLKSGTGYEFSHKSMQEYLFALHLVKLPTIPKDINFVDRFPNELAIAVSLSNDPSLYFAYIILNRAVGRESFVDGIIPLLDRMRLEDVKFRAHPYLALAFLKIFTLATTFYKQNQTGSAEAIKQFFDFFNRDLRLEASTTKLNEFYSISNEGAARGSFEISRAKAVQSGSDFEEPDKLLVPFDLYRAFATDCLG